jgi:hypothetical protein
MDKKDWEESLKHLKEMRDKYLKDLEEMNYTIECYETKLKSYS